MQYVQDAYQLLLRIFFDVDVAKGALEREGHGVPEIFFPEEERLPNEVLLDGVLQRFSSQQAKKAVQKVVKVKK